MPRIADEDPGLQAYMVRVDALAKLEREEERDLARRAQRGDTGAGHRLVAANLRHVVRIAISLRGYGLRTADLVSEGNLGLLEAVQRFDPERGLRFMTYASFWIRAFILAHILKQRALVGVGTGPLQSRLFFRLARERGRLTAALGADATRGEIDQHLADHFRTTPERIRELGARLDAKDVSLDTPAYKEGGTTHLDLIAGEGGDPGEELEHRELVDGVRRRVAEVVRTLPEREQYIVDRRLMSDEEDTLADIGRVLHLSRERVRQLEERIKDKLQGALQELAS